MYLLRNALDDRGISWKDDTYDRRGNFPFLDLTIYKTKFHYKDHEYLVVSGYGTYGGDKGYLELTIDRNRPEGNLTAEEVMEVLDA